MITYRVFRTLGLLGAIWIAWGLFSGYTSLQEQLMEFPPSPDVQETLLWGYFITGVLPFGIIGILLVLPYAKLPRILRLSCAVLLCISVAFVSWAFFRPFITVSGFHFTAIPLAAWVNLTGYYILVVLQIAAIIIISKKSNNAIHRMATRVMPPA
jgi:uncharacterized membrane protein